MQAQDNIPPPLWGRSFFVSLVAGAAAGSTVDLIIFPLDTIKTRIQSDMGFVRAGAFGNLYAGTASVLLGAAPGSAVFFVTYDFSKRVLGTYTACDPFVHMSAASLGEAAACAIRVPVEVVKQRTQVGRGVSSWLVFKNTLKYEGYRGLYRGFGSTLLREIPFSLIQFPLWEWYKKDLREERERELYGIEVAGCGAMAGAIAGAITTPLDVAKTRIMLHKNADLNVRRALQEIWQARGFDGLVSGIGARSASLMIGGFVFFGAYEYVRRLAEEVF